MRKLASTIGIATIAFAVALSSAHAATANRTWVSHSGLSSNAGLNPPCSPTNPCDTFATALGVTNAGGEINCVDSGDFGAGGALNINKSVTIDCTGQFATIFSNIGVAIQIGGGVEVVLRGLSIENIGSTLGQFGIDFNPNSASSVKIENCRIFGFQSGAGILLATGPTAGISTLSVIDSIIENNGTPTNGGIVITPSGASSVNVVVERTPLLKNTNGIVVDSSQTTGPIQVQIRDSVIAGGTNSGVLATAPRSRPTGRDSPRPTVAQSSPTATTRLTAISRAASAPRRY
jgi:hypothetical protein